MKKFSPLVIINTFIRSFIILVNLVFFVGCIETLKPKEEMISKKVILSEAKSIDYDSEKDNFKLECFFRKSRFKPKQRVFITPSNTTS